MLDDLLPSNDDIPLLSANTTVFHNCKLDAM